MEHVNIIERVKKVIEEAGITVTRFVRFEVGQA